MASRTFTALPVASYRAAWHVARVRGCAARESPRTGSGPLCCIFTEPISETDLRERASMVRHEKHQLTERTCDAVGTAAVADGHSSQNLRFASRHIALADCRSSARPWIIPPRQRITQLQSLDNCRRTSPVEELGKKLVATINNIDHEQFHFIIAKAPEALP
jgi:hypothetical protein